jgi:acetoin utilization deacetylase AcuC-like enzyme
MIEFVLSPPDGDGVEEAFETSPHVLTVSLHMRARGFFPGSGVRAPRPIQNSDPTLHLHERKKESFTV